MSRRLTEGMSDGQSIGGITWDWEQANKKPVCPRKDKKRYPTEEGAQRGLNAILRFAPPADLNLLNVYLCGCGGYHVGKKLPTASLRANYRKHLRESDPQP